MSTDVLEERPAAVEPGPTNAAGHITVMDGLRGLAITLVVLYHYWQFSFLEIPIGGGHTLGPIQISGFFGVELFFFISGFCLFFPYAKGKVPTVGHFYYRRAIKILPSYFLALLVLGLFFPQLYPSTWQHGKLADLGMHLVFLQNLLPATHGSFDGVMWSLGVEIQFYLLFPLVAWVFRRRPWLTAAAMVAIAVAYRAWNRHHTTGGLGVGADQLPAFLDMFAFGMLAAWLMVWIRGRAATAERLRAPATAIAVIALVLVVMFFDWLYAIRYTSPIDVWRSDNSTYIGALFLVLAVSSAFALPQWRAVLGNRALVFLSTISYNLYLWHQAVGSIILDHNLWPAKTPVPTDDLQWRWTFTLLGIAVSIAVASLITYAYERPFLRNGVRGTFARLGQIVTRNRATSESELAPAPADIAQGADDAVRSPAV